MRYTNFESDDEFQQFVKNVTEGPHGHLEFILHAFKRIGDTGFQPPTLAGWPLDATVTVDSLWNEGDSVSTEMFVITSPTVPSNLPDLLTKSLEELRAQGSVLSWFVFEFIFDDPSTLGGIWGPKSVYGFATRDRAGRLALTERERNEAEWVKSLQEALVQGEVFVRDTP